MTVLKELLDPGGFRELQEYRLLLRVYKAQKEKDDEKKSILKENSEISSESLQNPSDPDAT